MSALKLLNEWGVLLDIETVYADGGTPAAATDGQLCLERPEVDLDYLHMGERRGETGPHGVGIKRVGKSGLFGSFTAVVEGIGFGAAYSATDQPSIHRLLEIAGFDGTVNGGAGSEDWTYVLGDGESGGFEVYVREQKYVLKGCYADLVINADGLGVPSWEFAIQGIAEIPTEAAVPTITWAAPWTNDPPVAVNIDLNLGSFASAVCRSFALNLNRSLSPRLDQNSSVHGGLSPGTRFPTLEVVIEADTFVADPFHAAGGIDPYNLTEVATAVALSLDIGATQYYKWTIEADDAQLAAPIEEGEDGATALWTLLWELKPSALGLQDNLSIIFD